MSEGELAWLLWYRWSGGLEEIGGWEPHPSGTQRLGFLAYSVLQTQAPSEAAESELRLTFRLHGYDMDENHSRWGSSPWWEQSKTSDWRAFDFRVEDLAGVFRSLLCCFDVWREVQRPGVVEPGHFFASLDEAIRDISNLHIALKSEWSARNVTEDNWFVKMATVKFYRDRGLGVLNPGEWLKEVQARRNGLTWRVTPSCPSPLHGVLALVWRSATLGLNTGSLSFCTVCGRLFLRKGNQYLCTPDCGKELTTTRKRLRDRVLRRIERGSEDEAYAMERLEELDKLFDRVRRGELTLTEYESAAEREFPTRSSRWDTR